VNWENVILHPMITQALLWPLEFGSDSFRTRRMNRSLPTVGERW
jgi:hypothetical protein